jgi:hypothetical protein
MRQVNLIGIYLLTSLVVLSGLPLYIYITNPFGQKLLTILVYIACSGGLGGTIYCIRGFYKNVGENKFLPSWTWWYIFRPIISAIIGIIVYFMFVGGLMSISNSHSINYSKSIMFYCSISFLAGFSFARLEDKLEQLSETIFGKKEDKSN